MVQIAQCLEALVDDGSAWDASQSRDKGDATRIMFEGRIVETLSLAGPRMGMSSCHKQTPLVEAGGGVGASVTGYG